MTQQTVPQSQPSSLVAKLKERWFTIACFLFVAGVVFATSGDFVRTIAVPCLVFGGLRFGELLGKRLPELTQLRAIIAVAVVIVIGMLLVSNASVSQWVKDAFGYITVPMLLGLGWLEIKRPKKNATASEKS